jgi:hypothetical protein
MSQFLAISQETEQWQTNKQKDVSTHVVYFQWNPQLSITLTHLWKAPLCRNVCNKHCVSSIKLTSWCNKSTHISVYRSSFLKLLAPRAQHGAENGGPSTSVSLNLGWVTRAPLWSPLCFSWHSCQGIHAHSTAEIRLMNLKNCFTG